MDKFLARYKQNGITKSIIFDKTLYNKEDAEKYLNEKGIQNFLFFFDPIDPRPFGENAMIFEGEIGFDISEKTIIPHIQAGKEILINSFGGDLWEGWKIHDSIKHLNLNPSIGVIGTCASAATLVLMSTKNRWVSENSRGLVHNPWVFIAGDDSVLRNEAKNLESEKLHLAKFYSGISGKSVEEMITLMAEERMLNADEMIQFNFARSKSNKFSEVEIKHENDEKMNNEQKEQLDTMQADLSGVSKLLNSIKNVFIEPVPTKNIVIQDVNGVEIDFGDSAETMEQIAVGATATIDGSPANGEYTLADGTVYVFENGTLTAIVSPEEDSELEALKAENEELRAENETLKSDFQNALTEKNELKAKFETVNTDFEEVKTKFEAFKNQFSTEKQEINAPESDETPYKGLKYKRKN
jgi:ATP-dependent protease ClpP protease subunit/cell division protein FtsB